LVALENDDFQWVYFVRIHRLQRWKNFEW
jgi:hypothetical protein